MSDLLAYVIQSDYYNIHHIKKNWWVNIDDVDQANNKKILVSEFRQKQFIIALKNATGNVKQQMEHLRIYWIFIKVTFIFKEAYKI